MKIATVYGIQTADFIKMGMTMNLKQRLEAMRLHNPFPCKAVIRRRVSRNIAFDVEKAIHTMLKPWHHQREWFTAPVDVAKEAAQLAVNAAKDLERRDLMLRDMVDEAVREAFAQGAKPDSPEMDRAIRAARAKWVQWNAETPVPLLL